ncbi:MAG: helix-turn-helix transcriptional regulator [Clostridia bacterium]|nr:helix-turn-helix transcriptional regulator [Clostridia bacterium]
MILADKIIEERKRCGMSQEELADKMGVSRQAVSKWESALTMPDIDKIIRLAELFGVTTDYLLKDDMEPGTRPAGVSAESDSNLRRVTLEEANAYMEHTERSSRAVSAGVAMCILSPALLIFLVGLAEETKLGLDERIAVACGMFALFALVAVAVFRFISAGVSGERFRYLEKEDFETAYGVSGVVRERAAAYHGTYVRGLGGGISLCIVAAVPLVLAGILCENDAIIIALTALLLVLVAFGVYAIVRVAMVKSGFDTLLEEGEYSRRNKHSSEKSEAIGGIYWTAVTAGYLAWSFIGGAWDRTWIVWPIAGVLFGAIATFVRVFTKDER